MKTMNTNLKKIGLAATLALIVFGFTLVQPKPKVPLDGRTYIVELYQDGKEKKYEDDDLKFTNGKFKSVLFMDWGFANAVYNCTAIDTTSVNKIYTFDCETKPNDKNQIMIWSGTINGDDIEGTAELQKNGKTSKSFTFEGALKQKPGSQKKTTTPTK